VTLGCENVASAKVTLVGTDFQGNYYEINPTTGNGIARGITGVARMTGLAYDENNVILYGSTSSTLYRINPLTGTAQPVGLFGHEVMHSIEFDSVNGILYGINVNNSPVGLWEIDVDSGHATFVGATADYYNGLAFDAATSTMYASNVNGKGLARLDLNTGATTLIGNFNAGIQIGTALAYHPSFGLVAADNRSSRTGPSDLYQVNKETGQASLIGNSVNGNVLGLAFLPAYLLVPEPSTYALGLAALWLATGVRRSADRNRESTVMVEFAF
jgi:hypothetical protein